MGGGGGGDGGGMGNVVRESAYVFVGVSVCLSVLPGFP